MVSLPKEAKFAVLFEGTDDGKTAGLKDFLAEVYASALMAMEYQISQRAYYGSVSVGWKLYKMIMTSQKINPSAAMKSALPTKLTTSGWDLTSAHST